jgi:hypothetical protein
MATLTMIYGETSSGQQFNCQPLPAGDIRFRCFKVSVDAKTTGRIELRPMTPPAVQPATEEADKAKLDEVAAALDALCFAGWDSHHVKPPARP